MRYTRQLPLLLLLVAPRCTQQGAPVTDPGTPPPSAPIPEPPTVPPAPDPDPPPPPAPSAACAGYSYRRFIPVLTSAEFPAALANAQPGDLIQLSDGEYVGGWLITASGTADAPITLCGGAGAVLNAGSISNRDVLTLRASYWTVAGITITGGLRGVYAERASHNTLEQVTLHNLGQEAVHWRIFSSHNVVRRSVIRDTGRLIPEYGEGVYIGQDRGAWRTTTGGAPDRSDSNAVIETVIGPNVTAEHVDVKEGTTGGEIRGNTFDGRGMVMSKPWVDSWVEIKGNAYTVSDNRGSATLRDGFQAVVVLSGWGNDNVFSGNFADVQGPGFGFFLDQQGTGNVVACDNTVAGAEAVLSNTECR
jgi:hypothetical protein